MRAPLLCAAILACSWQAPAATDIRVVETRSQQIPVAADAAAVAQLRLHLYAFRGSQWSPDAIMKSTARAAPLLAQCGIRTREVTLTVLDAPRRFHVYSTPVARELLSGIEAQRPALFFVDDTLNRPGYDAETIGLANSGGRPELAHTIWIAHGARDLPLVIAHELVHLLANSGEHSSVPGNLMREDTDPQNDRLTVAQCEAARANGLAQRMLDVQ